ncbi:MAG: DUF4142 domain-containing protein [Chryseolinea sp.]
MKNFIVMINIAMVLLVAALISEKETPSNSKIGEQELATVTSTLVGFRSNDNIESSALELRSKEAYVKDFIYQISESRIMDSEEGKLASQRGTSLSLKNYGQLMLDDQSKMLKDLRQIARARKMDIASTLGESKTEELSELHKLHGEEFDTKFIKMMVIDHRRDIRKLEKAAHSKDADIQVFATKYLPIVKKHLEKIEVIKQGI